MKNHTIVIGAFSVSLFCLSICTQVNAELVNWHSSNIQYLKGNGYKVGPNEDRQIVTFEHANSWVYGDFFGFVDYTQLDANDSTYYGELTPRFSMSKITGNEFSGSLVKDVLVTLQMEFGENDLKRYLGGFALDLKVPGFKFLRTNFLYRNNPDRPNTTWQFFVAWNYPVQLGDQSFLFEGFSDFIGPEGGGTVANQLVVPRFLWDLGRNIGIEENHLQVGVEWQYWNNKFGLDGEVESVPQAQIKWVF